ncbi:MAG: class II fructose-bisphosphate aldolase [Bacteroidales bacterium]|nr:class II fructose-bisphosphate aldolase [Bacteroidales bacterium]
MLVSTRDLFSMCYGQFGIAAVNVWDMLQVHGLFSAAQKARAPFIVQTTPLARNYAHPRMLIAMIAAASRIYPDTVFAIHLDHGNREDVLECIRSGDYNSAMIDASHESFRDNIAITRQLAEKAHEKDMAVEAELGVLSGIEDEGMVEGKAEKYTSPEEVEEFVKQTGCDSLAVAVGTSHGAYKFSGGKGLQFDILSEIQKRLPGFPLVLHGGSEVNSEEIQRINAAGGQLGIDARGVSGDELVKALEYGVCKINIATDARLIWTRVHREFFKYAPAQFDPVVPGKTYVKVFEEFLLEKFELLKSTGKATQIKNPV